MPLILGFSQTMQRIRSIVFDTIDPPLHGFATIIPRQVHIDTPYPAFVYMGLHSIDYLKCMPLGSVMCSLIQHYTMRGRICSQETSFPENE
jgi:hypothetical protein